MQIGFNASRLLVKLNSVINKSLKQELKVWVSRDRRPKSGAWQGWTGQSCGDSGKFFGGSRNAGATGVQSDEESGDCLAHTLLSIH